ncbi:unnamed protein product, partial [Prorocentrum cordatum]
GPGRAAVLRGRARGGGGPRRGQRGGGRARRPAGHRRAWPRPAGPAAPGPRARHRGRAVCGARGGAGRGAVGAVPPRRPCG